MEIPKENKSIPLRLRPTFKDMEYVIQLNDVYTIECVSKEGTKIYYFNSRQSLYSFVKGLLKNSKTEEEKMIYNLGFIDDCYIENTKYEILEVLNDYIDLVGEIFVR